MDTTTDVAPELLTGYAAPILNRTASAAAQPGATAETDSWVTILGLLPTARTGRLLYALVVKRLFDILAAAALLLAFSAPMLVIAIAVWMDLGGGVIFRQARVGRGGRRFTVYKFRTMRPSPDGEVMLFPMADGGFTHKVADDPRITRVGGFLRRTSLDELPQLWNVLRGDMSLVGPRPELPQIVGQYADWQHLRHAVRPGLTGWWQVSGRSDRPMHENTELDIHYVRHLSPGLDAQILARTIKVVVFGLGAF